MALSDHTIGSAAQQEVTMKLMCNHVYRQCALNDAQCNDKLDITTRKPGTGFAALKTHLL